MRTIERVHALFEEGAVVLCVENTYIPRLDGTRRRIDKLGKSFADCTELDGERAGGGFYMSLPTRAGDVVAVSDTEATWKIGRGEHTVTIRKESQPC